MSAVLKPYEPVTYLVFTTNALRNNIGDGTLDYYKRYESPYSAYSKEDGPFNADHPEFFYCNEITVKRNILEDELIRKARTALGNLIITQRKNEFCNEEIILLLSYDENEFSLNVIYCDTKNRKWTIEPFEDLADDSDITNKQRQYIMGKLINFYNERINNPNAEIAYLQEEYLT